MTTKTKWVAAALVAGGVLTGCSDATDASQSTSTTTVTQTPASAAPVSTAAPVTTSVATVTETVTPSPAAPAPSTSESQGGGTPNPGGPGCGTTSPQDAFKMAVAKLAPSGVGTTWETSKPGDGYDSFDPCLDLSYLTVDTKGATGSSPRQMLFFHKGEYLGTAFAKPFAYSVQVKRNSPGSITVTFHYSKGNDAGCCPSGVAVSTFTWNDAQQKVVQTGEVPR